MIELKNQKVRSLCFEDSNLPNVILAQEQKFEDMIKTMLEQPKWTLGSWKVMLQGQLNSWMMYIPGVSGSGDVPQLKRFKGLISIIDMFVLI